MAGQVLVALGLTLTSLVLASTSPETHNYLEKFQVKGSPWVLVQLFQLCPSTLNPQAATHSLRSLRTIRV